MPSRLSRAHSVEASARPHRPLPDGFVVVTGGAGFVGSHLVELLLARGNRVRVLDDLSTGSLRNLAAVAGHEALEVVVGSAADPVTAARACRGAGSVFHLAGVVGVQRLAKEPLQVMHGNLRCTEVMLEVAADGGLPILIASSSEVYGQGPVPFRESDPVRPGPTEGLRGGYACAKAMGEWLALAHAHERKLPAVVARLFNVVGPRQNGAYGMVLPRFLQQAREGRPLTVFGDGSQTRCFGAVREVVAALCDLLACGRAFGHCVNVGSDREVSVLRLAELVRAAVGSGSPIECVPHERVFPKGFVDPARRLPSLDRLRAFVGWAPELPVETIVTELAAREPAPQREVAARAIW